MEVEARPRPLGLSQNPAEVAPRVIGRFEVDAAGFSKRGIKIDVWVGADGFDPVFEEFADRLGSLEASEAQFVLAERRRQFADPPVLGWNVSH